MQKKAKVAVFGSFVVDLMGRAPHLPSLGETVKGSTFKLGPGGKGSNQGVAAHRAGADVKMITKVGSDTFAAVAWDNFKNEGMDSTYIFQDQENATGLALIMVDEITSQNIILVTLSACEKVTAAELEYARSVIETADIFLTQFETNIDAVEKAIDIAFQANVPVILNPAPVQPLPSGLLHKVNFFVPNEVETSKLLGIKINSIDDVRLAAEAFLEKGTANVLITLGENGVFFANPEQQKHIPSIKVDVVDTTGAGDAFCGALAAALAEGMEVVKAAEFATAAAALSVTKVGTAPAMPKREDVEKLIKTERSVI